MAFEIDEYGDIMLVQGDSGQITVNGLDTDKNYVVYFAIKNKKRNTIGTEQFVNSNGMKSVTFQITGSLTDLLAVPKNKKYEVYYYAIKACDNDTNTENTLILGKDGVIGRENTIIVFPKRVEGI